MNTLKIYNPVYVEDKYCYFSITDWNFKELADKDGNLIIQVLKDKVFKGQNIVNKKIWIKTKKLREIKVKLRPDEPLKFYYNTMLLKPKQTKAEKDEEILKTALT